MEQIHEQVKSDLLAFGKRNGACKGEYGRLYAAETIEEVIEVVKDNFWWCAKFKDFADVIIAHRELFGKYRIFANQDVKIREGVAYLCVSEGEINVKSCNTSTINATSLDTSTINAKSWDTSTINAESYGTSTINAESYVTSTINATSWGTSTINAKSWDTSTINADSWDTSTINAESYGTSTINAESYVTSTINAKSWVTSTIYATSYDTSTINAESWGTSTLIIRTSTIECKVNDYSIARYVHNNRIVVDGEWLTVEKR